MGIKNRTKKQVTEQKNRKKLDFGKKKLQQRRFNEDTSIPPNQSDRWDDDGGSQFPGAGAETDQDPDYVAFCVSRTLENASPIDVLWLRVATALRLSLFSAKNIDRKKILREFDSIAFGMSLQNKDWENNTGLRYEADKFVCYLVFGSHPRFRELFGYILIPSINRFDAVDISPADYNEWSRKESSKELLKKLVEFNVASVE